ncbi:MAG: metallophosphoesterase [Pirellulales bacterium]|nr:metallophosphoesterase [Pirellulales bacterium]
MMRPSKRFLAVVFFMSMVMAGSIGWAVEADPISEGSWTMIVLPDTQHYSLTYPDIFTAQTQWIADHKTSHNIQMVVHEGDITHLKTVAEFDNAKKSMSVLDAAGVPYSMCAGNHDYKLSTRFTLFNDDAYFGPKSAYAKQPTIAGFYKEGKTDSSYSTFKAGGNDWLVLSLEYAPCDEVIAWANGVAAAHPDHHIILNTHVYLYCDGTRYDWATRGSSQRWSPHEHGNDGQQLWDKLVKKHPNWRFVLNGHVLANGTGWLASKGDHGNVVHQILANYQVRTNGGDGYLRIMEFISDGDTVKMSTYSPYQHAYLTAPDQKFTLRMSQLPPPTSKKPAKPKKDVPAKPSVKQG